MNANVQTALYYAQKAEECRARAATYSADHRFNRDALLRLAESFERAAEIALGIEASIDEVRE